MRHFSKRTIILPVATFFVFILMTQLGISTFHLNRIRWKLNKACNCATGIILFNIIERVNKVRTLNR
jgi:hypothetical protein